ncbi:MAG: hypothetical protein WAN53_00790, partial [Candidatus Bathyarchaeia archaeon]
MVCLHFTCLQDFYRCSLIVACDGSMFDAEKFVQEVVEELRRRIKGKAVIGISGGVDSTTAAILVHRAIGENLR